MKTKRLCPFFRGCVFLGVWVKRFGGSLSVCSSARTCIPAGNCNNHGDIDDHDRDCNYMHAHMDSTYLR